MCWWYDLRRNATVATGMVPEWRRVIRGAGPAQEWKHQGQTAQTTQTQQAVQAATASAFSSLPVDDKSLSISRNPQLPVTTLNSSSSNHTKASKISNPQTFNQEHTNHTHTSTSTQTQPSKCPANATAAALPRPATAALAALAPAATKTCHFVENPHTSWLSFSLGKFGLCTLFARSSPALLPATQ
ncbi:hypothetical protein N656DRAFT_781222 [Canariomyces notabilis]|uniref:Uncharacterized protein n=1 Tax=Canariomyces notabilis TaxID=2074819 RepID=A0AAN6QJ48_9PEZI|nr:hypothetical protein N656DRAFT_781222 [Canariomyces arenarius]